MNTNTDTINKLTGYINQAIENENQAMGHLTKKQHKLAISEETKALEQIEKALKLLSPPQPPKKKEQPQNNQSNKKQDQQAKNNQESKKQQSNNKQNQKLSTEAALKLLAQLQKKAEDERKKREKEYGVTISPQQLPVEKDW